MPPEQRDDWRERWERVVVTVARLLDAYEEALRERNKFEGAYCASAVREVKFERERDAALAEVQRLKAAVDTCRFTEHCQGCQEARGV